MSRVGFQTPVGGTYKPGSYARDATCHEREIMCKLRVLSVGVSAMLLLGGCGADRPDDQGFNAEGIIRGISAEVPSMKPTMFYDQQTDPNQLLGRPGGYTSKGNFSDTRIPSDKLQGSDVGSVEQGGSVEVFDTPAAAQQRAETIQRTLRSTGILGTEYDYVAGSALLRLSGYLTPLQAQTYAKPLGGVTDKTVTGPVQ